MALREVIEGPVRSGRVLGTSRHAAWAAVGKQVMVVARPEAVRLPNCVVVDRLPDEDEFSTGHGAMVFGGQRTVVSRWWDPRPVLAATSPGEMRRAVRILEWRVGPVVDDGLGAALARRVPAHVIRVSSELIGRGGGLTPSGDDVLAGAFAAFVHLGAAVGDRSAARLIAHVRSPLLRLAGHGTTTLSGALIGHALVGEVALPVARLLRGFCGRGSIDDALDDLLAVGHSSGPALAQGVLAGASAISGGSR